MPSSSLCAAVALVASLATVAVFAQASAPVTRAEVKEQTKEAARTGQLTPPGPGGVKSSTGAAGTGITRDERKSTTLEAGKSGGLVPPGQRTPVDIAPPASGSTKTRAQRKAETKAAAKAGQLVPPGPGSPAPTR